MKDMEKPNHPYYLLLIRNIKQKLKDNTMNTTTKKAIGLGAMAGMRASIAPAVAIHYLSRKPNSALAHSKLSFVQSPVAAVVTKLLSAAEITTDKLPSTSNRITLSQTLPRVAMGAFLGAVIFQANKGKIQEGMVVGGASALVATFTSFFVRKALSKIPYVKDAVLGALEDAVVIKNTASLMKT